MKPELFWSIKEKNDHYIGLSFSSEGLFACTLPFPTIKEVKASILRNFPSAEIKEDATDPDPENAITDVIWNIWLGEELQIHNISIDFSGYSPKQIAVLKNCMAIPRGEVLTYGQLAEKSGFPNAARFVGSCMARNRLPLIIPCHRVVRSDGLGRYADNPELKKILLQREGYEIPTKSKKPTKKSTLESFLK
ncbi:MAG: methylated-DNA--[protein]-cysteine S-methyltransferase [Promethearchaeota archaeon]